MSHGRHLQPWDLFPKIVPRGNSFVNAAVYASAENWTASNNGHCLSLNEEPRPDTSKMFAKVGIRRHVSAWTETGPAEVATRTRCVSDSGQRMAYSRARKPPYEWPSSANRDSPRLPAKSCASTTHVWCEYRFDCYARIYRVPADRG